MDKKILRILVCIVMCAVLCILLISCGSDDTGGTGPEDDIENSQGQDIDGSSDNGDAEESEEEIVLDSKCFNIFYSSKYVCSVVLPKNATDIDKAVANKLRTELQSKAGKAVLVASEGDERIDDAGDLILIGNTSYKESADAHKGLKERSAKIKTSKNRMAIAYNNESSGLKIIDMLMEKVNACDKNEIKIKLTFSASYTSLPEKHEFVEYTGSNTKKLDYENGTVLYVAENNTLDAVKNYCTTLENIGFKSIQQRTESGHSFFALKGEQEYIYIYYIDSVTTSSYEKIAAGTGTDTFYKTSNGVVKIAVGPIETFAEVDMTSKSTTTVTPKLAMIANPVGMVDEVGQGYIFVLPDGRLIVQDSGILSYANEDFVYKAIKDVAPDSSNIVIAAWFISHPHGDHQGGFFEFIENHGSDKDIKIERVIYNYAKSDYYDVLRYDSPKVNGAFVEENCAVQVDEFYTKTEKYIPDVPLLMAHTGQIFNFGNNATVEVLFTVEDLLPDEFANVNNTSMVIRVTVGGQKVLLLADTAHKSNPMIKTMWGNYLKADIVQIAHHGVWTPDDGIYELIGAKVYLWPASYVSAKASFDNKDYNAVLNKIYNNLASDIYVSDMAAPVKVLDLPYVIQNDKAAEKGRIDSAK